MEAQRWDYHIHTVFSDGINTANEMAERAVSLGLTGICYCDHCRRNSDWLFSYATEIDKIRTCYHGRLNILRALECKALDHKGTLDIPDIIPPEILQVAAVHRIPDGTGGFIRASEIQLDPIHSLDCFKRTIEGLANNSSISRLAHPFSLLSKLNISIDDNEFWHWLSDVFSVGNYLLENNVKYDRSMVPEWFVDRFSDRMLPASDSHSVNDLSMMYSILYCN